MKSQLRIIGYIYAGRIYAVLISILLIPSIIHALGYESYGLIGFFNVLLVCLNILDAGIGGVLTRQSIISRESKDSYKQFLELFNKIIFLFLMVGGITLLLGGVGGWLYGNSWLNTSLPDETLKYCLVLMFCVFSIRYMQGPYRSILLSDEKQITLTSINIIYVTLSQPLTLFLIVYLKQGVLFYFLIQFFSSIVSTGLMVFYGRRTKFDILRKLPDLKSKHDTLKLQQLIFFSLQLSTLSILWVIVNQIDKLALTKYMPLSEYAQYSVALSVIALLSIISDPITQVLLPKLTKLIHINDKCEYVKVFTLAISYVSTLIIPLSIFMFFFGNELLFAWSGNDKLSHGAGTYLPWLFLGGVFNVLSSFTFLLRYSLGKLKAHTLVYFFYSIVVIPTSIYIAKHYLGGGASMYYAINSGVLFFIWTGFNLVFTFESGYKILSHILLPLTVISYVYMYGASYLVLNYNNRLLLFLSIASIGGVGVVLNAIYLMFTFKRLKIKLRD